LAVGDRETGQAGVDAATNDVIGTDLVDGRAGERLARSHNDASRQAKNFE
jgi:hypothetical protein